MLQLSALLREQRVTRQLDVKVQRAWELEELLLEQVEAGPQLLTPPLLPLARRRELQRTARLLCEPEDVTQP